MKTMLMFDLLTAKKLARSQLLLGVVVALVLTVSTGSALCIMPIMALMLAYSVGFTLVAFDERNDWERFRLTLPLSRANVVQGRYATFVVMTLVGLVLGVAVTAIVYGLSLALPQTELFAGLFEGMDWQIVLGMVAASIAFSLALWLVALPLVARFGMTKAVRYLPLAFIIRPAARIRPRPGRLGEHADGHRRLGRRCAGRHGRAHRALVHAFREAVREAGVLSSTPAPPAPPRQAGGASAGRRSAPTKGKEAQPMKAMFLMDFITVKKLLRRYLLLLLGMGGAAALMMGSHPGIIPYFGMISVVSVAQALALYDDRRDWSRFRLTMPLTRTGVVLGRYAFLAAVAVAGTLMGVAVYLAATLAVQGVPAYAALVLRPGGFDAIGLAWSAAASLALAFVVGGIMLPTFFSFGMGNGPRYAMALVMMVSVLAIGPIVNVWARPEAAPAFLGGLVSLATSSETFLAVAGALAASALALYVASCAACLAAYRRRDF